MPAIQARAAPVAAAPTPMAPRPVAKKKLPNPGYGAPGSLVPNAPQAPGVGIAGAPRVRAPTSMTPRPMPQQYNPGGIGGYQPGQMRTLTGPAPAPSAPRPQPQMPPGTQPGGMLNSSISIDEILDRYVPPRPNGTAGGEPGPGQYRDRTGNIYNFPQGYQPEDLPGPPGVGDYNYSPRTGQTYARGGRLSIEEIMGAAGNQSRLLGPELTQQLGLDRRGGTPITRGELGLAQIGEYARQERLAEGDLNAGVGYLQSGRDAIGSDVGSQTAMEIALRRALGGGQFNDDYLDQQRGAIRNRGAVAAQSAERKMAEEMARRGISGSLAGMNLAELGQQNALGVQGQLADFEQQAASAREEAERAALSQLNDVSYQQQQSRAAFDQALANAYLQNERSAIDFAPGLVNPKRAKDFVGGNKKPNASNFGKR